MVIHKIQNVFDSAKSRFDQVAPVYRSVGGNALRAPTVDSRRVIS
nr:hypothetical protein [Kibdelosporangium sp. MJ126-NF4]